MRWNFRNKKIKNKSSSEKKPLFKNPLFNKSGTWTNLIIDQKKTIFLTVLLILGFILYLMFYSSLLKIREIELMGFDKISAKSVSKNFIATQLNSYKFLIFRQDNLLIFDKNELINEFNKHYSLENISIEKKIGHKLIINIKEKIPFLIYSSNNKKFFLDENGMVSSQITDKTNDENITIITNNANEETSANEIIFSKNKINFILDIVKKIKKISKINVASYSIPNKLSFQLTVNVEQGYSIYFDMNKNLDEQIIKLRRVMDESKSSESPTDYIDLRIGERVYIK